MTILRINDGEITVQPSQLFWLKPVSDSVYQWLDQNFHFVGEGSASEFAKQLTEDDEVSLLVPADQVILRQVSFEDAERKLLSQTVRYSLEPELSGDVEASHFALAEPDGNSVDVAIINVASLKGWLQPLITAEIELEAAIPEQLVIPWRPSTWTIVKTHRGYLVRYDQCAGYAVGEDNLGLALSLLLQQQEAGEKPFPDALRLSARKRERDQVMAAIPFALQSSCEWLEPGEEADSEWRSVGHQAPPLNMLQGAFSPSLPWERWWRYWRVVAVVAIVAVALQAISGLMINYSLQQDIATLQQQIQQAYREVVPKGKLVDAERQLRRKVKSMKGEVGSGFMQMYKEVATVVGSADGISMQSMSYSSKQGEIRMTLIAPSFNDIEKLRSNIEQQNISAKLSGISNEQGKTRARLVIKG